MFYLYSVDTNWKWFIHSWIVDELPPPWLIPWKGVSEWACRQEQTSPDGRLHRQDQRCRHNQSYSPTSRGGAIRRWFTVDFDCASRSSTSWTGRTGRATKSIRTFRHEDQRWYLSTRVLGSPPPESTKMRHFHLQNRTRRCCSSWWTIESKLI